MTKDVEYTENNPMPPALKEPGVKGMPGSFDDSADNLPGSQEDPLTPNLELDPEAPISSARVMAGG